MHFIYCVILHLLVVYLYLSEAVPIQILQTIATTKSAPSNATTPSAFAGMTSKTSFTTKNSHYEYSVSKSPTGSQETHTETRTGDIVQEYYTVEKPDGTIRTFTYTSDPIKGFKAVFNILPASNKSVLRVPVVSGKVSQKVA